MSLLPNPSKWESVDFVPRPDNQPWTMTVVLKRGYPVVIDIPGGGGPGTGARQILEIVTLVGVQKKPKPNEVERVFLEVMGSA
jgi:hypothetical protein